MDAFFSTPRFIKCLTDISMNLSFLNCTRKEKKAALMEDLIRINQHLPANVYIPFVNSSLRNHAVLHIPPNECHVFQTKERSPFLICIELYRPDELSENIEKQPFGKVKTKQFSEYVETEVRTPVKNKGFKNLGKLLPQIAKTPKVALSRDIEKLADIQVSKPLFAKRTNKHVVRSFVPKTTKNSNDIFVKTESTGKRLEKSKIAKAQPLI